MKNTIFLVAGCPSTDIHGAHFIRRLRNTYPGQNYRFIGIGGPEMQKEGLESVGVSSNNFLYKPFFPFKNFFWQLSEAYTHPVHAYTHIRNYLVLRKLNVDNILQQEPQAFVTFENQFFMKRFYQQIRERTQQLGIIAPPTFFWGLTHKNENHHHQYWLDHFFTRAPITPINWQRFNFPHTQVGWEGLFEAYKFIFSRNENYQALTTQKDLIFLPADIKFPVQDLIGELVLDERARFRLSQNVGDQDTVLFLATGNSDKEIKFSVDITFKAVEDFFNFQESKNIPKESITLVISIPETHLDLAQSTIAKYKWPIRVIQVSGQDSKFSAIAGSDVGIAVNGQIVAELAGLQLPTVKRLKNKQVVLDPEPFLKSYYKSLWNSFCVELNLASDGEVYPELMGSSIPMNLALHIQELYQDPKLRFYYVDRYSKLLLKSLTPSDALPQTEQSSKYPNTQLKAYQSGFQAMADNVHKAVIQYKSIDQSLPHYKKGEARVRAFQALGWSKGL